MITVKSQPTGLKQRTILHDPAGTGLSSVVFSNASATDFSLVMNLVPANGVTTATLGIKIGDTFLFDNFPAPYTNLRGHWVVQALVGAAGITLTSALKTAMPAELAAMNAMSFVNTTAFKLVPADQFEVPMLVDAASLALVTCLPTPRIIGLVTGVGVYSTGQPGVYIREVVSIDDTTIVAAVVLADPGSSCSANIPLTKGVTLRGPFTSIQLSAGKVICYAY